MTVSSLWSCKLVFANPAFLVWHGDMSALRVDACKISDERIFKKDAAMNVSSKGSI